MEKKYIVYLEFEYEVDPPRKETIDNLLAFIRTTVIHTMVRQLSKIEKIDGDSALNRINEKYVFATLIKNGSEVNDRIFHLIPKEEYTLNELEKDWKLYSLTEVFMRPELGIAMLPDPDEVSVFTLEIPQELGEIYKNGHLRVQRVR
jgi:hypothetical protein